MSLNFDAMYDDRNFGECAECGDDHVLCEHCGLCLKYCHPDDFCPSLEFQPPDSPLPTSGEPR